MDHQQQVNQIEFTGQRVVITDSEDALIGSVLKGGTEVYNRVREIVDDPTMFHNISYGEIWNAIQKLFEQGLAIDTITVGDELERAHGADVDGVGVGRRHVEDAGAAG